MVGLSIIVAICALCAITIALPQPAPQRDFDTGAVMGFNITFWKSNYCHGKAFSVIPVDYDDVIPVDYAHVDRKDDSTAASYKISRDMVLAERLDFFYSNENTECDVKMETTSPDSNNHPLLKDTCYNFSKGPVARCFKYFQPHGFGSIYAPSPSPPPQLRKRYEDTGIKLHTWEQLECPGDPTESHELLKDEKKPFNKEIRAYKVSHPFTSNQMLDFSNTDTVVDPNNKCGHFLEQTNPMKSPIKNSWVLIPGVCYPFTGHLSAQVNGIAHSKPAAKANASSALNSTTEAQVFHTLASFLLYAPRIRWANPRLWDH